MRRIGQLVVRHRRAVIVAWLAFLVATTVVGSSAFSVLSSEFGAGDSTESGRVAHRLDDLATTGGQVVVVADGIDVAKPLHIVHVSSGVQPDTAWHVRVLVEAGQGSRADIVEQFVSMGEANQLGTVVTDYVVRESARLGVVLLHSPDPGAQARKLLERGFRLDR